MKFRRPAAGRSFSRQAPRPTLRSWLACVLAWVLAWCLAAAGAALAAPVVPGALTLGDGGLDARALTPWLAWREDPQGLLEPADVVDKLPAGAYEHPDGVFSKGYTRSTWWLRVVLRRGEVAPADWLLRVERANLDDVQLHHRLPDGQWLPVRQAGDARNQVGALDLRVPAYALDLGAPGEHVLLLRVRSGSTMLVPVTLSPGIARLQGVTAEYFVLGLFHGATLVLVLIGLGAFAWLRERLFLYYSGFILANGLLWFAFLGLLQQFLSPGLRLHASALTATLTALAAASGTWLYAELLQVRAYEPRLWRVLCSLCAGFLAAAVAPWLLGTDNELTPWVLHGVLLMQVLVIGPTSRAWRSGRPQMRLTAIVLLVSGVLTVVNAMLNQGWIGATLWTFLAGPLSHLAHLSGLLVLVVLQVGEERHRRARAEALTEQTRRLHAQEQAARQDQGHLLSMIAHEIRTPVSIIDAALQSLRVLDEQVTPDRARRHERIARALDRMGGLVDLVLSRDRLDVSVWHQELAEVAPAAATAEVLRALGPDAQERVRLHRTTALPQVCVDERMLRFALQNLLDNALKYSPRGAQIDVRLQPALREGRAGCLWTMLDQGRGVAEAERERIFEKYYRAADVTGTPGLGLGLFLVRQIFERHQGTVRAVPTESGNGGCFEAWLPAAPAAACATVAEPKAESNATVSEAA